MTKLNKKLNYLFCITSILLLCSCNTFISKSNIEDIYFTSSSTVSVIQFDRIAAGGELSSIKQIKLMQCQNGEYVEIDHNTVVIRLHHTRGYIFNLPEGEYFISSIYPYHFPLNSQKTPSSTLRKFNVSLGLTYNTHCTFDQENYANYPLIVKSGTLNTLGHFKSNRKGLFTEKSTLTKKQDMDQEKERDLFFKKFGYENPFSKSIQ